MQHNFNNSQRTLTSLQRTHLTHEMTLKWLNVTKYLFTHVLYKTLHNDDLENKRYDQHFSFFANDENHRRDTKSLQMYFDQRLDPR